MLDPSLLLSIALPVTLGFATGWSIRDETRGAWYMSLKKPTWQPPAYVFGPVWTVLYVLMGVAAWRVWRAGGRGHPMTLYATQLALNVAWSFLFFKAHNLEWALFDIVALLGVLVATTASFAEVDVVAGRLMVPYLAWVAFATMLTVTLYVKNRAKAPSAA